MRPGPDTPTLARHKWLERDRSLAQALHRASAHPGLLLLLAGASRLGDGVVWYGAMLALPFVGGPAGLPCALRMLLLGLLNLVVYRILKRHFARPRPFVACPGVRACTRCLDEHSFPSGHTLHAVAFGTLLTAYYPGLAWVVWPFVALVAASRVVLGLHFPSDVVVGAAMGGSMAFGVLSLF
jgi:undecaprenyl-diphosphatase